jgi:hypothetical protein
MPISLPTQQRARAIGGDVFDMVDCADGSFAFIAGDAAGNGPAAARLTSKILGIGSVFVSLGDDPAASRTVIRGISRGAPRPDRKARRESRFRALEDRPLQAIS